LNRRVTVATTLLRFVQPQRWIASRMAAIRLR